MKYCAIVPCYRHASTLDSVLSRLAKYRLPVIVVDDGNDIENATIIEQTVHSHNLANERVTLLKHEINQGKGGSVTTGLKYAYKAGFTHAIQVDSDGQHCIEDIDQILKLSKDNEDCVISGIPVYDANAPRARVIGRKITNFFVHVETLSSMIKDAMIGFRVYPLEKTVSVINKSHIGSRMNFDIEVLVRLVWNGVRVKFFETKVDYPKGGISNFKPIDNVKISLMHTKLCCISILTLPVRIFKNAR